MPGAVTGGSTSRRIGTAARRRGLHAAAGREPARPAFHVLRQVEPRLPMPECLMTSNLPARAYAREAATTKRRGVPSRRGEPGA